MLNDVFFVNSGTNHRSVRTQGTVSQFPGLSKMFRDSWQISSLPHAVAETECDKLSLAIPINLCMHGIVYNGELFALISIIKWIHDYIICSSY